MSDILVNISLGNGLSPYKQQAIILTLYVLNFSEGT